MLIYYLINCALLPSWEQKSPFFASGLKLCKTLETLAASQCSGKTVRKLVTTLTMLKNITSPLLLAAALLLNSAHALAEEVSWRHAIAMHGEPQYAEDFAHFDYVNPSAAKGGSLRLGSFGSFDSLNSFAIKGSAADGLALIYDTLTKASADEAFTHYGLVASAIRTPEDRSWVEFRIHPEARFADGEPITSHDVKFSFDALVSQGQPLYQLYYSDVSEAVIIDDQHIRFNFSTNTNRELPLILGQIPVLPEHYWRERDFTAAGLDIPLGSGAYRIAAVDAGRSISYERNPDYWARDLPVNKGYYNFDSISYDYYKDFDIRLEAFKSGKIDVLAENRSKAWATAYDFPAVQNNEVIKAEFAHSKPSGMQGYVFNTRRELFSDSRVREAINLAFDFEWTNKNLLYSSYIRSQSYFSNSELGARGLPSAAELAILEPYREQLPEAVFTSDFQQPVSKGDGNIRARLRAALPLLRAAGWELEDGTLQHAEFGDFNFEILLVQAGFERLTAPFIKNLERLGIKATMRVVDTSQYINRMRAFDFDMIVTTFAQSDSPGNEQRNFWSSASADASGSRNFAGVRSPVVDQIVEQLISAKDRQDLINHTRALDRVLLSGYYVVPQWHIDYDRVAYWNKFAMPEQIPASGYQVHTWWQR